MSTHPDPRAAILAMADEGDLIPLVGIDGAFVRQLSVSEMDRLHKIEKQGNAFLIVMAVCDAKAVPLFCDEDVPRLLTMKALAFTAIVKQVSNHNGLGVDAGAEAVKN
ncbi:hypothetical protein BH10PSE12_BH10PSE12_02690 [soil metagenome]